MEYKITIESVPKKLYLAPSDAQIHGKEPMPSFEYTLVDVGRMSFEKVVKTSNIGLIINEIESVNQGE